MEMDIPNNVTKELEVLKKDFKNLIEMITL